MQTLLYCAPVAYASAKQRPQWIAEGLSRHYRVLYLDPHRSLVNAQRLTPARATVSPTLEVLSPRTTLPASGFARPVNRAVSWVMARDALATFAALGWSAPDVLITTFPKHADLVPHFAGARLAYDVMDDYAEFFGGREAQVLTQMHGELLRLAKVVTVSSETLRERVLACGASAAHLVPNAVDDAFAARVEAAEPNARCLAQPAPRFGYVGTLASWIDADALVALATGNPHASVILVGPGELATRSWPANVHFLGEVPHAAVPGVLRTFAVGLVPFRRDKLTDAVNPVKVYEYLAAGLPVLATPTTELTRFGEGVCLAPAGDWGSAAAKLAVAPPAAEARRALVKAETWESRLAALTKLLSS